MKKTYYAPEVRHLGMILQNMIALSKLEGEANPDGEVLSRHRTVWDVEEEDEW